MFKQLQLARSLSSGSIILSDAAYNEGSKGKDNLLFAGLALCSELTYTVEL